jgi:hypothetical protein
LPALSLIVTLYLYVPSARFMKVASLVPAGMSVALVWF